MPINYKNQFIMITTITAVEVLIERLITILERSFSFGDHLED